MTTQPLPKNKELTDKINSFFLKRRKLNDLDIPRLKKEASNLLGKIDVADYWDFMGQIASLENNKDDVIVSYQNAIKLAPNDYNIQYNYVVCLENRGLIPQAIEQAEILVDKFPNELEALVSLVDNTYRLCRFKDALQLLNTLESPAEYHAYKIIIEALDIFENAQLSDNEAQNLCQLAFSVLETQNIYFSNITMRIWEGCLLYTIYVDLPLEEIFEVNWELDKVFVENFDDTRSDVLMFQYSSIKVLEEKENYERIV